MQMEAIIARYIIHPHALVFRWKPVVMSVQEWVSCPKSGKLLVLSLIKGPWLRLAPSRSPTCCKEWMILCCKWDRDYIHSDEAVSWTRISSAYAILYSVTISEDQTPIKWTPTSSRWAALMFFPRFIVSLDNRNALDSIHSLSLQRKTLHISMLVKVFLSECTDQTTYIHPLCLSTCDAKGWGL